MARCRTPSAMPLLLSVLLALLVACSPTPSAAKPLVNGRADLERSLACLRATGVHTTFLRLLTASGFKPIMARYIQSQPVTFFAPTDAAFAALDLRARRQLTGSKLVKLLEYHMLLHKYSADYLSFAAPGSHFRTVYGIDLKKQPSALSSTVIFSPPTATAPSAMSLVTRPDICGTGLLTLSLHGVNRVLIPREVFF